MNFGYEKIKDFFVKHHLKAYLNLVAFYMPYVIAAAMFLAFFVLSVRYDKPRPIDNTKVNSIDSLVLMPFNGTITSIVPRYHGSYYIGMIDKIGRYSLNYSFNGRNLFSNEYNIKVGDSISKYANSDTIIFYRYEGKELDKKSIVYTIK